MAKIVFDGGPGEDDTRTAAAYVVTTVETATTYIHGPDLGVVQLAPDLRVHVRSPEQAEEIGRAFLAAAEGLRAAAAPAVRHGQWPAGEGAR